MSSLAVGVLSTGLVTSVGMTASASCAAMRARVTNPSETNFVNSNGEPILAHQVHLERPWRGVTKLAKMAALAIDEALTSVPKAQWKEIPLLLCVAEEGRPGRTHGLQVELLPLIERELDTRFGTRSAIVAQGRVGAATALAYARSMIANHGIAQVLIAGTDSLVTWPSLRSYSKAGRLLTETNSDGFMPGEGAGAALVGSVTPDCHIACIGIGFSIEDSHIDAGMPQRAEGLSSCFRRTLTDAGCELHDLDFRVCDVSGEQYYFKEASLALDRVLRKHKFPFAIWHPAETIGETGALAGLAALSVAHAAAVKNYAEGPGALLHFSNDNGARAAIATQKAH